MLQAFGKYVRISLFLTAALALAGCGWRLDRPRAGHYRAVLETPGGELPFQLKIGADAGQTQLWVITPEGHEAAVQVQVEGETLRAQLPHGRGALQASIHRNGLDGSLELTGAGGQRQKLPLRAEYGASYRFFAESATDNVDVSGHWTLQCPQDPTNSYTADLQQSHDQVDGVLRAADGAELIVQGQVHGEDVFLGGLGAGRALLYKARFTRKGRLEGDLWNGMQTQEQCVGSPHPAEPNEADPK